MVMVPVIDSRHYHHCTVQRSTVQYSALLYTLVNASKIWTRKWEDSLLVCRPGLELITSLLMKIALVAALGPAILHSSQGVINIWGGRNVTSSQGSIWILPSIVQLQLLLFWMSQGLLLTALYRGVGRVRLEGRHQGAPNINSAWFLSTIHRCYNSLMTYYTSK